MNELKKKFIDGLNNNKPQLLTKNLIADIETPISSLLKIKKNQNYSFLLESVEGGSQRGRYSLLGCDPDLIWKVHNNFASITYNYENYNYKISDQPMESLKNLIDF
jgi:anthranilate synthase component 1